jgi:hypothetical protein
MVQVVEYLLSKCEAGVQSYYCQKPTQTKKHKKPRAYGSGYSRSGKEWSPGNVMFVVS